MNSIVNTKLVNYIGPVMVHKSQGECLFHVICSKLCQTMGSLIASVNSFSESTREGFGSRPNEAQLSNYPIS